jgi:site-specific recombinase XerD
MPEKIITLEQHIGETHSHRAIYGYIRIINQYIKYIGEENAKAATYQDVVHYMGVLRESDIHPKTMMNHLFSIKMYYQWLADTMQRDDHPCRDLYLKDKINKSILIETLYSKEELQRIISTQKSKMPLTRTRDRIILSLLGNQAVTVFEIIHLKVQDVNLKESTVNLAGSVKTEPRVLPLKGEQIMLLNDYITQTRPTFLKKNKKATERDRQTLILSTRGNQMSPISITQLMKEPWIDGKKITPQKIRQSVIMNILKSGQDIRIVQESKQRRRIQTHRAGRIKKYH